MPVPITEVMWARDRLPNMLWLTAMLAYHGERDGIRLITTTLDELARLLPPGQDVDETRGAALTGTLTSLDEVPEHRRADAITRLKALGLYDAAFPPAYARAMSRYPGVPGAWILTEARAAADSAATDVEPEAVLAAALTAAWEGQTRVSTLAKAVVVRGYLHAGRLHFPLDIEDTLEALSRYPFDVTEDERRIVEPFIRTTYGAVSNPSADTAEAERVVQWAQSFWRANWALYPCTYPELDVLPPDLATKADDDPEDRAATQAELPALRKVLQAAVDACAERFAEAHDGADPDLYHPARNEVLTGIAHRHVRAVDAMIRYPALWSDEQSTFVMRNILEGRIVFRWLVRRNDPSLFDKFKDYGRGHLKLQVLHLREYRDKLGPEGAELDEYLGYLESLLNRDGWEEMQDISLDGNFAGVDTRRMALAVGLEDEYRLIFAPMSSDIHGEWASLDRRVMIPCSNPLHRGHRIPNQDRPPVLRTDLVRAALQHLDALVSEYADAMARAESA